MNVLIVEDESQTAQRLADLLNRYDASIRVLAQLASVSKTLAYFRDPAAIIPDLLFLDIHLEDDLGFRILEELEITIPVIFTTAYNEYALRAFKNFSIDYLLKPIDYDELCEAIVKFRKVVPGVLPPVYQRLIGSFPKQDYKERFLVSAGSRLQSIPVSDVAYFSYEQKAAFLNTISGQHLAIDYSLDALLGLIDPKLFFRINRSYIISLSAIRSIDIYAPGKLKVDLHPKSGQEVFVSTDRIPAFKEWLGR
jgi:DNA-binding LytR/AlgR family response regulator